MVPIWGGWSDIFFIVPPVFIYLWLKEEAALIIMITTSIFIDLMLSLPLPYYTLASITAWAVYYLAILPYLWPNTQLTRVLVFLIWLLLWRASYIVWLLIGWLVDGPAISLDQPIVWPLFGWFILGLCLLGLILASKALWFRYLNKVGHP